MSRQLAGNSTFTVIMYSTVPRNLKSGSPCFKVCPSGASAESAVRLAEPDSAPIATTELPLTCKRYNGHLKFFIFVILTIIWYSATVTSLRLERLEFARCYRDRTCSNADKAAVQQRR